MEEIKAKILSGDCDVKLTQALVMQGSFGSLVLLRSMVEDFLERAGGSLVYMTLTPQPIYTVNWNDLSPEKQKKIERKMKK